MKLIPNEVRDLFITAVLLIVKDLRNHKVELIPGNVIA